jgi:hypothetical protein
VEDLALTDVMDDILAWLDDDIHADPRQQRSWGAIEDERDLTRMQLSRWPTEARDAAQAEIDDLGP